MRRIFILLNLLLASLVVRAQSGYEPTSTWPYAYSEFAAGEITRTNGNIQGGIFNIHLLYGKLHFLDNEYVREVNAADVKRVKIGTDTYANVGGRMMRVVAENENGFVAEDITVDIAKLNTTGGAYGSSSNTLSTSAATSIEGATGTSNVTHMELKNRKESGKILPLIYRFYIVNPPQSVFAGKKDVMEVSGVDKDDLKAFLKEHSIKWREPESLLQLVDYFSR